MLRVALFVVACSLPAAAQIQRLEADAVRQSAYFDGLKIRDFGAVVHATEAPWPRAPLPKPLAAPGYDAGLWKKAFEAVYSTLELNFQWDDQRPRNAIPAPRYPGVYLWDSAFIAEVWRPKDAAIAEEVIQSVLKNQKEDGRVPQVKSFLGTSPLSNPPLLSWAAMRIYRQNGDKEFLLSVYEPLKRFRAWYYANRRLENGLFFWKHPYESGLDNSPRFADRKESRFDDTTKIMAIDLSSYLVLDGENLAEMAAALGRNDDAAKFRGEIAELKALINSRLWDEESGFYFDRRVGSDEFVRVRSIASLTPLVAGVPSQERADILVEAILDPRLFNTPTPFPSVARSDPSFEKDCWRGPVWVNMAYLSILGMQRYGYGAESKKLAARLVNGVYRTLANTGELVEFYDPERNDFSELTRKKGNWYKSVTLGDKPVRLFVGWTGLVNNLVLEHTGMPPARP